MLLIRVLTSIVLLALMVVVGARLHTPLLNGAVVVLSVLAVLEMYRAIGLTGSRGLFVRLIPMSEGGCNAAPLRQRGLLDLAIIGAVVIPYAPVLDEVITRSVLPIILFALALGYFAMLVKNYGKVSLGSFATAMMLGMLIPLFFSSAVFIRDMHGVTLGGFYLLLALGAAWMSDTCAYFVGTIFGKHKLAPVVSPKKTIEGTVGGAVLCTGLMLLLGVIYQQSLPVRVDFVLLALFTPILSLVGMLGDLSASVIKREYGVKDFGRIMPGHGGVLDRFDSVLFTLPAVYVIARHFELVRLI